MILDTNAVSDLLDGNAQLAARLGREDHHLPLVVIGEYQYGLQASRKRSRLQSLLRKLISGSYLLTLELETADHYAAIRQELKEAGTPIPENDIWIAASARQHKLKVVSQDDHFDCVKGLRRVSW